ncbi:variable large family protein (plasmid) [Borrelia coriaceae]|uniref:Variable large protein n=1 Tax=Borrelia coriaceae ATCC 43381 TaxID=1408429 RepID=W5SXC7_9SPIR|nr:variable large family protein [Borrelia coriaceae]AHH11555.1 Variable major protein [Borrelia coriaceae ATCC 43381]UPA17151.1 variable large family protein [Borrelia coriaceae]
MKINIKNIRVKSICATLFISLFLSCNNGVIEELEKKNTFFDSLVKIGHGFQEIFGSFGNAMGDALGFNAVKPNSNRSEVKKHFDTLREGLKKTKDKLGELSKKIVSTPHANTKGVEGAIKEANDVFDKLIASLTKLAGAAGTTDLADGVATATSAAGADQKDVNAVIDGVKEIIEAAEKSNVKINSGNAGSNSVANGVKVLTHNAQDTGAGPKLAEEVSKADPWAMIDKIKNTTAAAATNEALGANSEAGKLAASGNGNNTAGSAKTNADLAAAVALKAMTKGGKFSQAAANEDGAIKAAAANAVNKVLGILDLIIRQTVVKNLDKIREAVKEIQYSETIGTEKTEAVITTN